MKGFIAIVFLFGLLVQVADSKPAKEEPHGQTDKREIDDIHHAPMRKEGQANEQDDEKVHHAEKELHPREDKGEGEDIQHEHDSHEEGMENKEDREEGRAPSKEVEGSIAGEKEEKDAQSHGSCNRECTNTWKNTIECKKGKCNFCATMFYQCKCKGVAMSPRQRREKERRRLRKINKERKKKEKKEFKKPTKKDGATTHGQLLPSNEEKIKMEGATTHGPSNEEKIKMAPGSSANAKRGKKGKKRDEREVDGKIDEEDQEPPEEEERDDIEGIIDEEKEEPREDEIDAKQIAQTCNLELKASFMELDSNRDRYLEDEEIAKFFNVLATDVAKAFKQFDNNGDGKLDKDEFIKFKLNGDPAHAHDKTHVMFKNHMYWVLAGK